jgi:hypothetical protein
MIRGFLQGDHHSRCGWGDRGAHWVLRF